MQNNNITISRKVTNIQKFIIQNFPKAVETPHLSEIMMEIVLREANNSERNVIQEMARDIVGPKRLGKSVNLQQGIIEAITGVDHFTNFYNGFYEIMIHLDNVFYHVKNSSTDKYVRRIMHNDYDQLDMDLTQVATLWYGTLFSNNVDDVFHKYIVEPGHYPSLFGKQWSDDCTPLSEQMKIRAVLLLVITMVSMSGNLR